jgi:hypothetical protein
MRWTAAIFPTFVYSRESEPISTRRAQCERKSRRFFAGSERARTTRSGVRERERREKGDFFDAQGELAGDAMHSAS